MLKPATLASVIQAKRKALNITGTDGDPVQYILDNAPNFAGAVTEAERDPSRRGAAADLLMFEQERLGVPKDGRRVLSRAAAGNLAAELQALPGAERAKRAAELSAGYGDHFPGVVAELSDTGLDPATKALLRAKDDPVTARELARMIDLGGHDLRQGVDKEDLRVLSKNIDDALAGYDPAGVSDSGLASTLSAPELAGVATNLALLNYRDSGDIPTSAARAVQQLAPGANVDAASVQAGTKLVAGNGVTRTQATGAEKLAEALQPQTKFEPGDTLLGFEGAEAAETATKELKKTAALPNNLARREGEDDQQHLARLYNAFFEAKTLFDRQLIYSALLRELGIPDDGIYDLPRNDSMERARVLSQGVQLEADEDEVLSGKNSAVGTQNEIKQSSKSDVILPGGDSNENIYFENYMEEFLKIDDGSWYKKDILPLLYDIRNLRYLSQDEQSEVGEKIDKLISEKGFFKSEGRDIEISKLGDRLNILYRQSIEHTNVENLWSRSNGEIYEYVTGNKIGEGVNIGTSALGLVGGKVGLTAGVFSILAATIIAGANNVTQSELKRRSLLEIKFGKDIKSQFEELEKKKLQDEEEMRRLSQNEHQLQEQLTNSEKNLQKAERRNEKLNQMLEECRRRNQ